MTQNTVLFTWFYLPFFFRRYSYVAILLVVFVHHSAIQNDGGFKSLAEGEEVRPFFAFLCF